MLTHIHESTPFVPLCCRDVQQPGHAESTAADLGKPSVDAEHAVRSLHAQYDAVTGSKPRVGLPGMKQKDVCTHTHHTKKHPPI